MVVNDILQQKLKKGKINEKELIALFGSDCIKRNHQSNGCFRGDEKARILKKAREYCNILDNRDRTFTITKIYKNKLTDKENKDKEDKNELPNNFNKMNKGLYQYICPAILSLAIESYYKNNNNFSFTPNMLAKKIKMVNYNYELIRYHAPKVEKEFQLSKSVVYDFFNKCDSAINYYIPKALQQLIKANLITVQDKYCIRPVKPTIIHNGIEYIAIKEQPCRIANEQDMIFYEQCIQLADACTGIKNNKERYYGKKSKAYNEIIYEELKQGGIKYLYKIYEIRCVDINKCKKILEVFNCNESSNLNHFNNAFTEKLISNAQKREIKCLSEYSREQYLDAYSNICGMVINSRAENLKEKILSKDQDENIV